MSCKSTGRRRTRWTKKTTAAAVGFCLVVLAVVLLVGAAVALARLLGNAVEVEVGRPALEPGGQTGSVVLTAGGYIVAHHPIDVSSKVVGKVAWVGVEKGDRVHEGQVIVRLEDTEFAAQLDQAKANVAVLESPPARTRNRLAPAGDRRRQGRDGPGPGQLPERRHHPQAQ